MKSNRDKSLERRVHEAANQVLAQKRFVSPLDILLGAGFATQKEVNDWRLGKIPYLERITKGGLGTLSRTMAIFNKWAVQRGLKPSWTDYRGWAGARGIRLQFSKSGQVNLERRYSTHYVLRSPESPETPVGLKRSKTDF